MKHYLSKLAFALIFALAMIATSCSNDPSELAQPTLEDRTLSFTATLGSSTRGTLFSDMGLLTYTIYGYNDASQEWFMDEITMDYKDNEWLLSSENPIELPNEGTSYFFSFSGQVGEDGDIEKNGVTFVKDGVNSTVKYSMPEDILSQPNLIMSPVVALDANSKSFQIDFAFQYVLSTINFTATGDYTVETLSTANFISGAEISFAETTYSAENYLSTSDYEGTMPITITPNNEGNLLETSGYLFVPAQSTVGLTISYTATAYDTDNSKLENIEVSKTLDSGELEIGKMHTYDLSTGEYVEPEPEDEYDFNLDNYGTDETSKGWTLDNFKTAIANADAEGCTEYVIYGSYGFDGDITIFGSSAGTFSQITTTGVTIDLSGVIFKEGSSWASGSSLNDYQYRFPGYAFNSGLKTISKVILPADPMINGLKTNAFINFYGVETIENTEDIHFVDSNAFQNCTSLKSIDLPKAFYFYNSAFYHCTSLTSLNLPDAYDFGYAVFNGCTNLTELRLTTAEEFDLVGNGDYSSGSTFYNFDTEKCELWLNINKIGDVTTSSNEDPYVYASWDTVHGDNWDTKTYGTIIWKKIHFVDDNGDEVNAAIIDLDEYSSSSYVKNDLIQADVQVYDAAGINYYYVIGDWDIDYLDQSAGNAFAFLETEGVTIDMGESYDYNVNNYYYFGNDTFNHLSASKPFTNIKKIVIPGSCTSISGSAFVNCPALEEIVAKGVTYFGSASSYIFSGCSNLKAIDISGYTYNPSDSNWGIKSSYNVFSGITTENITITLNAAQASYVSGNVWASQEWGAIVYAD